MIDATKKSGEAAPSMLVGRIDGTHRKIGLLVIFGPVEGGEDAGASNREYWLRGVSYSDCAASQRAQGSAGHSKMHRVFDGYEMDISDFAVGSITDSEAVARALEGLDAVVHCAAMVSRDAANAKLVHQTNLAGAQNVLGQAFERGLESIIHDSSMTSIWHTDQPIDEHSRYSHKSTAYVTSKKACDA
jgi:NAD(P)-dependent dehydrogenase (short-subunit alcohol dehydrogenase family)